MNTVHIFIALIWAVGAVGSFTGGLYVAYRYAIDADLTDVSTRKAITGTLLRILAALALTAVIIGVPLDLIGF